MREVLGPTLPFKLRGREKEDGRKSGQGVALNRRKDGYEKIPVHFGFDHQLWTVSSQARDAGLISVFTVLLPFTDDLLVPTERVSSAVVGQPRLNSTRNHSTGNGLDVSALPLGLYAETGAPACHVQRDCSVQGSLFRGSWDLGYTLRYNTVPNLPSYVTVRGPTSTKAHLRRKTSERHK
jgi:hypothetical protein